MKALTTVAVVVMVVLVFVEGCTKPVEAPPGKNVPVKALNVSMPVEMAEASVLVAKEVERTFKVERKGQRDEDGNTVFSLMDADNRIYEIPLRKNDMSYELPVTNIGDEVRVKFDAKYETWVLVPVTYFNNETIPTP